ncbi:MAG: hypothetical protein R2729_28550 [Bryobacteraceae bacterium]
MAQVVIEFGALSFGPIMNAMLSVIGTPSAIETESASGSGETCPATKDAIEAVSRKFLDGQIVSATFRTKAEGVRYGLILKPRYGGQDLSMWMGTVELTTDDWRQYWDALLRIDALAFVCVGDEEGVELTDERLTAASFPWDEWPTLAGALRGGEGGTGWVIRERKSVRQSSG